MKELITADDHRVYYTGIQDPDRPEHVQYTGHWSREEFAEKFGVTIPEDVTSFSIEPFRQLYSKIRDYSVGATYNNISDDDLLESIYLLRGRLRKHSHAQILTQQQEDPFSTIIYDEVNDQFINVHDADRDHQVAKDGLDKKRFRFYKHFLELIEVLHSKGIVNTFDFSDEFVSDIQRLKQFRDQVDWQTVE
jgi:hypothetical protein